uniref:N-acetyltransferase domain-containing protein n=1 Tax=Craspedostauros australis TaxID=1486917 RepID=A0A7R9ZSG1_9STRA
MDKDVVLDGERAEAVCKSTVASLGPKQRREYKNASVKTIATELLSPDTKAVCVLSNLAVSPNARRRGIANVLCDEAEALASDWGYSQMHLLVEEENTAARSLYEGKLGYQLDFRKEEDIGLRADLEEGVFQEVTVPTLVLSKNL